MTRRVRRNHSPAFKAKVALAAIKGEKTLADRTTAIEFPASDNIVQSGSTRPLRVLVVDDNSLVLANAEAMLEDLGHDVVVAGSGEQALRILRGDPSVALLLTDQLMPGISGAELMKWSKMNFAICPSS